MLDVPVIVVALLGLKHDVRPIRNVKRHGIPLINAVSIGLYAVDGHAGNAIVEVNCIGRAINAGKLEAFKGYETVRQRSHKLSSKVPGRCRGHFVAHRPSLQLDARGKGNNGTRGKAAYDHRVGIVFGGPEVV